MNNIDIESIVKSVIENMQSEKPLNVNNSSKGAFDKMEDAIEASIEAQKVVRQLPLEFREKIIDNIRKKQSNTLRN